MSKEVSVCLLRLPQVKQRTGLSRSTIYLWIQRGDFPPPVNLGDRAVAWTESSIDGWIDGRVSGSSRVHDYTNRKARAEVVLAVRGGAH